MNINLKEIPFSYRGSYMAISYLGDVYNFQRSESGLYLRTLHGSADTSLVAKILMEESTRVNEQNYCASCEKIEIYNENKKCYVAYTDCDTILFSGNMPIVLDFMTKGTIFTFAQPFLAGSKMFTLMNCFQNNCRYMLHAEKGNIRIEQDWNGSATTYCRLIFEPDREGNYSISLEENFEDWKYSPKEYNFNVAAQNSLKKFDEFCMSMPLVPEKYKEAARIAAYVDWESFVKPCGLLKRETMLMSKNWMSSIWSWDHCFNAIALAYHNPREAWEQFILMFDYQKPSGNIQDSLNDCKAVHNYCKPPIHGWALRKLMSIMKLSKEQMEEAYDKVGNWTRWWLECRDENGDGLCEYTHGNDSGWDNSSAFCKLPPTTLPDLAAFLIIQMDVLRELAETLGKCEEAAVWQEKSKTMKKTMLNELFVDNLPIARTGLENKQVKTESLILYLPIVLGRQLPENVQRSMIDVLKSEKFCTAYGLATENPKSSCYESDGYWRGPIWAPSTMLILDGLWDCGEKEFVRKTAEKFCNMVAENGCSENFDALTGAGLRDRAYTWTASVMMIMAHEFLE